MTHEEFVGKLSPFFSIEQIQALENYGYKSAADANKDYDITDMKEEDIKSLGRQFVCDELLEIEDIETINTMLPDNHPMDVGKFIEMETVMDAYGEDW